jgi:hypothetical protein
MSSLPQCASTNRSARRALRRVGTWPLVLRWLLRRNGAVVQVPDRVGARASAEPGRCQGRLAPFRTAAARGISTLPGSLGWLLDFEVMRAADSLAISNSSVSFSAAFLNDCIGRAARPCSDFTGLWRSIPPATPCF